MTSHEDWFLNRLDDKRKKEDPHKKDTIAAAFGKAEQAFYDEEDGEVDPERFGKVYPVQDIESDLALVNDVEESILRKEEASPEMREQNDLEKILAAIVADQCEQANWLGQETQTRLAARYDDIKNGVGIIVEFTDEKAKQHPILALDITSDADLKTKLKNIKDEVDHAESPLSKIKYFESSDRSVRSGLVQVPRVLIGIDRNKIADLAKLWVDGDKKALRDHPIQIQILEEIALQLETMRGYAKMKHLEAAQSGYDTVLPYVDAILEEKRQMATRPDVHEYSKNDRVKSDLRKGLSIFMPD
jgi:hypothetical protein